MNLGHTTTKGMLILKTKFDISTRKVLGYMAQTRVPLQTYGRTDGRTYTIGKSNICLAQGENIILNTYKLLRNESVRVY